MVMVSNKTYDKNGYKILEVISSIFLVFLFILHIVFVHISMWYCGNL